MKRGDLVTVALPGDYGKPRPALVIQSDLFDHLRSITVLPLTSEVLDANNARVSISPTPQNGLRHTSYVMIDKINTLPRVKTGEPFGSIASDDLIAINRALALFLGFG